MKKIFWAIFFGVISLSIISESQAQFFDDFSDGDFSQNPAWVGMADSFFVSTGQLRSQSGTASSADLYLSMPAQGTAEIWRFFFRLNFNPSSQNYAEVWLMSDNPNLTEAQNGYFVRLGGNSTDGVGLFKIDNGTVVELISQNNTLLNNASNNQGNIIVTRSTSGVWTLQERISSGTYVVVGSQADGIFTSSQIATGVRIKSTKSNRGKHYFDDIGAGYPAGPDVLPPNLLSASMVSPTLLNLVFNEGVDAEFASQTFLYSINPNQTINSAFRLPSDSTQVRLVLGNPLPPGSYQVTVSQSKDIAGNTQTNQQNANFSYIPLVDAYPRAVVINEIYADENPSYGLAGEFVELFNTATGPISLKNWTFSDASASITLPDINIPQGGRLILCKPADTSAYKVLGPTLAVSLPALNNSGDSLTLKDNFDNIIDEVNYALSWYRDPLKDDGGFSLEQINPGLKCSGAFNWSASTAAIGGTPGLENSIFSNQADISPPTLDSIVVIGNNQLKLVFNEALNSTQLPSSAFNIPGANISEIGYGQPDNRRILLTLANPLENGQTYTITITGIRDCEGNTAATINRSFVFLPPGALSPRSVVINEVYADETPSLGLPEAEYIELLNTLQGPVQLKNMVLTVGGTEVILPEQILLSGGHLVLCDEEKVPLFQSFGAVLGINLPTLNNSGSEIRLNDANGNLIDKIAYDLSWYRETSKQNGGYSLEQINPTLVCSSKDNWTASNAGIGGTPAIANSVVSNAPDVLAPSLISFEIIGTRTLRMLFSEPLSGAPPLAEWFSTEGGIAIENRQIRFPEAENLTLTFATDMIPGVPYLLRIQRIDDCNENSMAPIGFSFGVGVEPNRFDLLLTEVQADDSPENGLPQAEYVEIYNRSTQLLNLKDVRIQDQTSSAVLPFYLLKPGEFLILTGTSGAAAFQARPGVQVLGLTSFPTLNTEGDKLLLLNARGAFLHRFFFRSDAYAPYTLWTRGWSLELIDPSNPCDERNNWAISTAQDGGTPGKQNSVWGTKPDLTSPILVRATVPAPSVFRLVYSELVDSAQIADVEISISGNYNIVRRFFDPGDFSSMYLEVSPEIQRNELITLTVGAVNDCAGNTSGTQLALVARPNPADSSSWLLNEILFDPQTGGTDYVEIKNVSPGYLDARELRIGNKDESKPVIEEAYPVAPGGIVLLTNSTALTLRDYPRGAKENFLEIDLPGFNSDSGTVRILGPSNQVWQKYFFSEKHHARILDETKGVSLERISKDLPVENQDSWQSASKEAGYGTPGLENSQNRDFDPGGSFSVNPVAFSPNGDGNKDFALFSYETEKTNLIGNLRIYSADGFLIRTLAESSNLGATSVWKWDGSSEEGRKVRAGLYLAILELVELGGDTRYEKIPVAIAHDR